MPLSLSLMSISILSYFVSYVPQLPLFVSLCIVSYVTCICNNSTMLFEHQNIYVVYDTSYIRVDMYLCLIFFNHLKLIYILKIRIKSTQKKSTIYSTLKFWCEQIIILCSIWCCALVRGYNTILPCITLFFFVLFFSEVTSLDSSYSFISFNSFYFWNVSFHQLQ
jgi:hypothetical protein